MIELNMRTKKTNLNDGILFKLLTCKKDVRHLDSAKDLLNKLLIKNRTGIEHFNSLFKQFKTIDKKFQRQVVNYNLFVKIAISVLFYKKLVIFMNIL